MSRERKETVVVVRRAPYGNSLARSAIESVLAMAAFEQPVSLLFAGDGVLQLMPGQAPVSPGCRNMGKLLASLPLYGVERVYVDAQAACRYQLALDRSPVPVEQLDATAMAALLQRHDHLLGF